MKSSEYLLALCHDTVPYYVILLNTSSDRHGVPTQKARKMWQRIYKRMAKKHNFGQEDLEQWVQICESWFDCHLANESSDD